jgi:hypothetical protein
VSPSEALTELTRIGFRFRLNAEGVKVRFQGRETPNPSRVTPLLALLKEHKAEVVNYLVQKSKAIDRVLTCYECGHFCPAASSPKPDQAWGYCQKRSRGRYGVAMACEEIIPSQGAANEPATLFDPQEQP